MSIDLATKYLPYTDELFSTESKKSLVTNEDFSWDGAHTIKIYSVTTSDMNDYGRGGPDDGNWSRYGPVDALDATTQSMPLRKDRSFTFAIDTLDENETAGQLEAASALARQLRQVVIPEVDKYTIGEMISHAGNTSTPAALTASNVYDKIIEGSKVVDNAEAPEDGRVLFITPAVLQLLKKNADIQTVNISEELKGKGVVGELDGMLVSKVPANRLPDGFGFLIAHQVATVAPTKLESYVIHANPPGINGSLVEGRIVYDAFVLDNKAEAIYYYPQSLDK